MEDQKMETGKFGGGIINTPEAIKHIPYVIKNYVFGEALLVFSAFGKTTDHLGDLAKAYQLGASSEDVNIILSQIYDFHMNIAKTLFPTGHIVFLEIDKIFEDIKEISLFRNYFQFHLFNDQIISFGEILALIIVSNYLNLVGINNKTINAFDLVDTNNYFGHAEVKESTFINIRQIIPGLFSEEIKIITTHGFLGSFKPFIRNSGNFSLRFMTTIGREGSDYTAGIFGNALDVSKVTLWKNVPGIMDKDPNVPGGEGAKLFESLSYNKCEELLSGTAKGIIHPKTIALLKQKKIPLLVKSFWHPELPGTLIS